MGVYKNGQLVVEKRPKTKIMCTLGPASRSTAMIENLLRAGMNVAPFHFSHGFHEYHQETLNNLRATIESTSILCTVMLDTKVESQEGVADVDDILANSDAFMVARGDLGMEISIEKIFFAQKVMIYKCNIQGKLVMTVTQMLESMIKSLRPIRAEATDVAKTNVGAYLGLTVRTMAKICVEAESTLDYGDVFKRIIEHSPVPMSPLESLASSAVKTANSTKAALILVLTRRGSTAKLMAKYRPGMPILSVVVPEIKTNTFNWSCSDEAFARHSLIFYGFVPILSVASARASHAETTEEAIEYAIQHAKVKGLCKNEDSAVALHHIRTVSVIKILTVK